MPGIIMEGDSEDGPHTNHDRDPILNGRNGTVSTPETGSDKGKPRVDAQQSLKQAQLANGSNGSVQDATIQLQAADVDIIPLDMAERIKQLPPEIIHITEGFEPLSRLLVRLAQVTHNRLSAKIMELAAMPTPSSTVNGNGMHYSNGIDDNTVENVRKKVNLLKFAEATHADWTKALVITHWSRISKDVSKVIDLKVHLDRQKLLYDSAFFDLSETKRSLVQARVPNPDLRTAVEVLSTGKASWMPELSYIDPPPLTAAELLKSLQDLNTLLSIRLNLHEYDKIPPQFKDYSISSGRVTFKVPGEFEVDLTIADEDPEKQFWFIDFRFLFTPTVSEIPDQLRFLIGDRVDRLILPRDGLLGCYRFLHELVLTHKINELRRQAIELNKGKWIETLQVEPLHRALSIQYWLDRYGKDGPRSWIIIGVDSGKRKDGSLHPKDTSHISLRWFRDAKEIKDHGISLELTDLSVEAILQTVITKHVFYILESIYKNIVSKPLFSDKQLSISFQNSDLEPREPELRVQLTRQEYINIRIESRTGFFSISPAFRIATRTENHLNNLTKDPTTLAHGYIENLRCVAASDEIVNRAITVGWNHVTNPGLKPEDLKPIMPRDTLQLSWFKMAGWSQDWYITLSAGMSGERWWLMEIARANQGLKIISHIHVPLGTTSLNHTYGFLSGLHLFAAALVSYYSNLRILHERRIRYTLKNGPLRARPSAMKLPAIFVKLSDILPSKNRAPRSGKAWAQDIIKLSFQGLEHPYKTLQSIDRAIGSPVAVPDAEVATTSMEHNGSEEPSEKSIVIAEACLKKPMPSSLDLVKQRVDKDIAFHPKSGGFAFRLHTKVGDSAVQPLVERLQRIEQLVDFVEVVKKHEKTLHCETISLSHVIFSYNNTSKSPGSAHPNEMDVDPHGGNHRATIEFSGANEPMTMTLEPGNPQIRILDHLTKTLNSPVGLNGVATLLPLTLPLMTAFDAIEDSWTPLTDRGDVVIFNRALDRHVIRYNLNPDSQEQQVRKIMFHIRLQNRREQAWWCIRREKEPTRGEQKNAASGDDIDTALKSVWEENPEGEYWRGMRTSGIARIEGIEELVRRVDDVVRSFVVPAKSSIPNVAMELKEMQQLLAPGNRKDGNRPAPHTQQIPRTGKQQNNTIILD